MNSRSWIRQNPDVVRSISEFVSVHSDRVWFHFSAVVSESSSSRLRRKLVPDPFKSKSPVKIRERLPKFLRLRRQRKLALAVLLPFALFPVVRANAQNAADNVEAPPSQDVIQAEDQPAASSQSSNEAAEIRTPLEVLELLGIGESELASFKTGSEISREEQEVVYRLLARLPRFPRRRMSRWQQLNLDWQKALSSDAALRATIVRIDGKLIQLTREELPAAIAQRVRYTHYYRAVIAHDNQNVEYTVFLRRIPTAFVKPMKEGLPVRERVAMTGFFLKSSFLGNVDGDATDNDAGVDVPEETRSLESESAAPQPKIFLAGDLLEWYPDDPASGLVIDKPSYLDLASYGMDVGTLGTVKDHKSLTTDDREAFYQMLASVGAQPTATLKEKAELTDATALLQTPHKHRGRFYSVNGTARRAIRIEVQDRDIVERFGITHYYEIEVFDHSANVRVKDSEDSERSAIYHSYPVVFCARTIPEGMPTGDLIHENVQINGAYLKLWAYATRFIRTQIGDGDGPEPMQISPLLIGHSPLFLRDPPPDPRMGLAAGLGFIAGVVGLWGLVLWYRKGDEKFRRETLERHIYQEGQSESDDDAAVRKALANLETTFASRKPTTKSSDGDRE